MIVVSTKSDYGMRAAVELARHYASGEPVQVRDIAERQGIPKDFLSLIMVDLRKGGVVESVRGPHGGYRLARPPVEVSMAEVLEVLEGPIQLLECVADPGNATCRLEPSCTMRGVWSRLTDTILEVLRGTSLEQLALPELVAIRAAERTVSSHPAGPVEEIDVCV